jgi:hypothetical protein
MYFRSSLRMSSVRMKTKLSLPGFPSTAVRALLRIPEKNRITNAAEANSKTVFLVRQRPYPVSLRHHLLLLKSPKGGALSSRRLSKATTVASMAECSFREGSHEAYSFAQAPP